MNKTIAFFLRDIDPNKPPFSSRELYYYSYQEYLLAMKRAGARAYFVTGNDSYAGGGVFKESWTLDEVGEVSDLQATGEIKADVVFDKGGFEGIDIPVVTDHRLHPIMSDKQLIYEAFGRYQPKTLVCEQPEDLARVISELPGDMVVVKGREGTGGKRVYIGKKSQIEVPADETYPLLVQEFIDMSEGIPGIAAGPHDVRILMTGHTIIGATLRQPAPGELHSNVSRGGSERLLHVDDIPAELKDIARKIDDELEDLPRYYAIDFARGKRGWVLIELNKKPGLFRIADGPDVAPQLMDSLANYLVELT